MSLQTISKSNATMLAFAAVILTPYLSRLVHGIHWMTEYLPSDPMALLFFAGFAAIPGAMIWMLINKWPGKYWQHCYWGSLAVTVLLLAWMHHDYDLSVDAQSAIGLIIIPVIASLAATAAYIGIRLVLWFKYK